MWIQLILTLILYNKHILCQISYDTIIGTDYNRDIAPTYNGQPVEVNVSIVVLSLTPDSGAKQSFDVDFFYHLYWNDHRLKAPSDQKLTLGPHWKSKLWIPNTYFRNSIRGGVAQSIDPEFYFTLTNYSTVYMGARLQLKLRCNMKFRKFPFDSQTCHINISSLSQPVENVQLYWLDYRLGSHVVLPEFEIVDDHIGECTKNFGKIGEYSCLYVVINLSRKTGKYFIKRFIPSLLIVIMTFIGFWIPTQITPARVSLIITSLLALIAQQIQGDLNISYIYALEVWTIICIVFVFSSLIEFAIANAWPQLPSTDANKGRTTLWLRLSTADHRNCIVDIVARFVFPFAFIIAIIAFSLCYYFS